MSKKVVHKWSGWGIGSKCGVPIWPLELMAYYWKKTTCKKCLAQRGRV